MVNEAMFAYGSERSAIREIFAYATARKAEIGEDRVFDFSLGNPSVPAPPAVRDAIVRALEEVPSTQLHGYTPAPGLPEVRSALADSLNRRFATTYSGDDLFLTAGAAASMAMTIRALTSPGDEVMVITPYFPEYRVWIEAAGATCVEVPSKEMSFRLSVGNVQQAITERTAAIIVNSPNNPTGRVYRRETLVRLANVLREANAHREQPIYVISDEPYREISYGQEVSWIPSIYPHTVVCYSYSKALSLAGERIGWVLVPNTLPDAQRVRSSVAGAARALGFVCAPALFQRVVAACADEPADIEAYRQNRDLLCGALGDVGYTFAEPEGAFYLWVRALEPDAQAFCDRARELELLPVPSDSFGVSGWVRVGYCVDTNTIRASLPAWCELARMYRSL
ncbi:pyridoxal phosphate-dependent aminotransferase [Collinsella sp. AGMB00827]|uniref:Aminotransferase n=1 Tax=Collinsella ureilytica TaxID=2869515 RepID=A0ABS7MKL8_9ACTN|nr:pyridoxal phosphate-dependent aminotransferase [Collinsella urealyticum]MBY4797837.1 pyridoxal phosphate-dependent aminotransferase [Collinsella urealyticum]